MSAPRPHRLRAPGSPGAAWVSVLLVWVAAACDADPPRNGPPGHESSSASSPPASRARPGTPPAAAAVPSRPTAACRVTRAEGLVRSATGGTVARGQKLSSSDWLELSDGAVVHLKHTRSGRELSVTGPGRLLACAGGREELFVGRGTVETQTSAGTRPGAQVLVGTPFGAFHYADARVRLSVEDERLSARIDAGRLWLSGSAGGDDAEVRMAGKQPVTRGVGARVTADAATRACQHAAREAHENASRLMQGRAEGFGDRAAAHVRARQRAKSACATAIAASLREHDGQALRARLGEISGYEALWRGVPSSEG